MVAPFVTGPGYWHANLPAKKCISTVNWLTTSSIQTPKENNLPYFPSITFVVIMLSVMICIQKIIVHQKIYCTFCEFAKNNCDLVTAELVRLRSYLIARNPYRLSLNSFYKIREMMVPIQMNNLGTRSRIPLWEAEESKIRILTLS